MSGPTKQVSGQRVLFKPLVYGPPPMPTVLPVKPVVYGPPPMPTNLPVKPVVYGPAPIDPSGGRTDLLITYEQLQENIKVLNQSSQEMRTNWNSIKNKTLQSISSSWVGKDSSAFVNKIKEMDREMENSFRAIDLLSNTYKKASNKMFESQQAIIDMINRL